MAGKNRTTSFWEDQILRGLDFRKQVAFEDKWNLYYNMIRQQFVGSAELIPLNLMYAIGAAMIPQIYLKDPAVIVTPTKPGREIHAKVLEQIANRLIRETKVKREIKKVLANSYVYGTGFAVDGYDSAYGMDERLVGLDALYRAQTNSNRKDNDPEKERIEFFDNITSGLPWFLHAQTQDIVLPLGCRNVYDAEWYALRVWRLRQDVMSDAKYSKTATKDVPTKMFMQPRVTSQMLAGSRVPYNMQEQVLTEWVELWQIHDRRSGNVKVIVMDHPKFLRDDKDAFQITGLNLHSIRFNEDTQWAWGIPDCLFIEPQQRELNDIRTQAAKERRANVLKAFVKQGALNKQQMDQINSDKVRSVVEVDVDATQSLGDVVHTFQGHVNSDLFKLNEMLRTDIQEMVGFSRNQLGGFQGKTHISKEETQRVALGSHIRMDERQDMVADLLTDVVRRYFGYIFKYWTAPQAEKVVGPFGQDAWIQYTGPQLEERYDIKIDPTNALPKDPLSVRNEAKEMIIDFMRVHPGMPVPPTLLRHLWNQYEGIEVEKAIAEYQQAFQQAVQIKAAESQMGSSQNNAIPINRAM